MLQILSESWAIYRRHFWLFAAITILVWLPLNLVMSYFDYFVFEEDEFRKSFRLAQFLDSFFGVIALSAVTFIAFRGVRGQRAEFAPALGTGFFAWGRMFVTRLLMGIAIVIGLILLVFPGLYLAIRFSLAESVVITEGLGPIDALNRSWALTRNRAWFVTKFLLMISGLLLPALLLYVPSAFFPELDHWILDAFLSLILDFGIVMFPIGFVVIYQHIIDEENAVDELPPLLPGQIA